MDIRFDIYLKALAANYRDGGTEHTGRTALENLLNTFAIDAMATGIEVQHEPKRDVDKGAPDFKVKRLGMILGYVEVKEIGANLDKVLKSEQIIKYRKLSNNIVVTDYLQFIRIDGDGKILDRQSLAFPSDIESRAIRVNADKAEAVSKLLSAFFSSPPQGLQRAQQLAVALATRSKLLRDYLTEELVRQTKMHREGRLHALYDVFREQVFHELTVQEFADAFAQMLAYGLFLAKLNASDDEVIRLDNVRGFIPGSFRLIRELVRFLEEMQEAEYDEAKWVVDEILSIVNGLAIANIREDLSFRQRKAISRKVRAGDEEEHRLFERDPFIYFYEDFLKAYDKETRKSRGVYYTPPPVVNFIVRAVDDILKDVFKIGDGLADHKQVTVLDFAAGTGTFLLEVMQRIFDNIGGSDAGKADAVVREHMLRNLYGFEYLIAPYTIAHLKLSQYLKDQGHTLHDDERLQVFLTNTLEPVEPQKNLLMPAVAAEVEAAQGVKKKPILIVLGNPPYSGHSKNPSKRIIQETISTKNVRGKIVPLKEPKIVRREVNTFAGDLIDPYRFVDGKELSEKNPKWLNDDYVKFIGFAQWKMAQVDEGVVGIITNHSWLDNPTFRGMRQSLIDSFDQIYLVDLHGSTKPKEMVPEGEENENVFDIQKGVAIALLVKKKGVERGVWYTDMWGSRLSKYQECAAAEFAKIEWVQPKPSSPYFMLSPLDWTGWDEYGQWWQIADSLSAADDKKQIFTVNVLGFQTHRDHFAIALKRDEMIKRVSDMRDVSQSDSLLQERYSIKDNRDWRLAKSRRELQSSERPERGIIDCAFRPFDVRSCYFGPEFMDYPRRELIDHVAGRKNLLLLVSRQIGTGKWRHGFVASQPAESCLISDGSTEQNYCFPLVLFNDSTRVIENFSFDFRTFLDTRYDHHYSAEEILGYIYAILHAPTYRSRYADFLRIDFPRVPFAEDAADFEALSALGWSLVQAHLLVDLPRLGLANYHGKGANDIEHVRWSAEDERISINRTQSFSPVPEAVWSFHIGGYQVIDKYLKSRKDRVLSLDEINHVGRIADALAFTIEQMSLIDAAYAQAFPNGG
ncbi:MULTISPECIES: type ISP restriction/modification enzyme [unclassified Mesorhizobium]|uniref:type ISP restriction/modification enzyme n=1 Tax=unclassified Mesorhizobium TaxID=325217 RepID=UPI0015E3C46B|nr:MULTISPECIES: type ISP restriction/modification enzyme [unclassified Mesorhizobium]MBZ9984112.1 N-6 DNA methylase [Mesorhizobium sp. BR-1-1-8]